MLFRSIKDVREIKNLLIEGYSLSYIAEEFGNVRPSNISHIADGVCWSEVMQNDKRWQNYLKNRLKLKARRRRIELKVTKKNIELPKVTKKIKVKATKKVIELKEPRAPKRLDYNVWALQFDKGKPQKKAAR